MKWRCECVQNQQQEKSLLWQNLKRAKNIHYKIYFFAISDWKLVIVWNPSRGHSITTWARWGGRGSKKCLFCPHLGYKNYPSRVGGGRGVWGQKMAKCCPCSWWMPPPPLYQLYILQKVSYFRWILSHLQMEINTVTNFARMEKITSGHLYKKVPLFLHGC